MFRYLAILALTLSALRGVGGAPSRADDHAEAADSACHATLVRTTCCGASGEIAICPMSGGDCRCGARPTDDDRRPVPMPSPERERTPMRTMPQAIAVVHHAALCAMARTPGGSVAPAPRSVFTHNGYLALLGVWRR